MFTTVFEYRYDIAGSADGASFSIGRRGFSDLYTSRDDALLRLRKWIEKPQNAKVTTTISIVEVGDKKELKRLLENTPVAELGELYYFQRALDQKENNEQAILLEQIVKNHLCQNNDIEE